MNWKHWTFFAFGIAVELAILGLLLFNRTDFFDLTSLSNNAKYVVTAGLVVVSNLASYGLVGGLKDGILWPLLPPALHTAWKENDNKNSPIGGYLGILERIIVLGAGMVSFEAFFLACGGWLTVKIAVDWTHFHGDNGPARAIGHVYLITSASSLLLAGLDVVFLRTLWG